MKLPKFFENLRKLKFLPSVKKAEKYYILNEKSKNIVAEDLNKITCKTLVLNGGAKDVVNVEEAKFISKSIKDSILKIYEKDNHTSYTRRKYFYNDVIDFLEKKF